MHKQVECLEIAKAQSSNNSINLVSKLEHILTIKTQYGKEDLGIRLGFINSSLLSSLSEVQTHCGQTPQTGQSVIS